MSEPKQRLVLSIIEFLNTSLEDGTVKADDKESLEVAIQCIGEAFGVDPSDEAQTSRLSIKPAKLETIFNVAVSARAKLNASAGGSPAAPAAASTSTPTPAPSQSQKEEAEKLKVKGNQLMSAKNYNDAIDAYTQAIQLDATNPVYYSNRAAAHASKGDHQLAVEDAEGALAVDSKFIKAYSRLGHAHYSLGDYTSAASAFKRGLEIEPGNANLKSGLQNSEERIPSTEPQSSVAGGSTPGGAPDLGGLADMMRGMGGGGGGMPDLASLMNNPALMQMAQNMMQSGQLDSIMRNPAVANMMNSVQNGGGMPSMADIMNNPELRNLASQFGRGGGAGN